MVKEHKHVIKVGEFALIKDEAYAGVGLPKGMTIYVCGSHMAQSTSDPYKYRMIFIGARVEDDHLVIDDNKTMFTIDGKHLRLIKGKRSEQLKVTFQNDFGYNNNPPEEASNDISIPEDAFSEQEND